MGHGAHEHPVVPSPRWLTALAVALAVATVLGLAVLWPSGETDQELVGFTGTFVDATVTGIDVVDCPGETLPGEDAPECAVLRVTPTEGPDAGEELALDTFDLGAADFGAGEGIVLSYEADAPEGFQYQFSDRQRSGPLRVLFVLFAAAVLALGRWRGLAALAGLGASVVVLLVFTVPALLEGSSSIAVALVTASAIAFLAIYLAHGPGAMSTVALLGTLGALALTTLLSAIFVELTALTGLASEEALALRVGDATLDLRGLVLAGIIVGALGALDDMTVTQASTVWELHAADPKRTPGSLLRAGMRVGRDHVASTVNTLLLAYAGASMPLLLLFTVTDQPLARVANGELVATEIVRTLVGSIGLVAAVPLTTWLAVVVVRGMGGRLRSGSPAGGSGPAGS